MSSICFETNLENTTKCFLLIQSTNVLSKGRKVLEITRIVKNFTVLSRFYEASPSAAALCSDSDVAIKLLSHCISNRLCSSGYTGGVRAQSGPARSTLDASWLRQVRDLLCAQTFTFTDLSFHFCRLTCSWCFVVQKRKLGFGWIWVWLERQESWGFKGQMLLISAPNTLYSCQMDTDVKTHQETCF